MNEDAIWELQRANVLSLARKKERLDGRDQDEYRPISIELGLYHNAEGSARVRIGKTLVAAGVKMSLDTPYPDTPDKGNFSTNVELLAMASPTFEAGPPSPAAVELSRVVDRGLRESHVLDFEKLCIVEGEQVWTVWVDVVVMNYDGNLYDASALAAMAALANAKIPKVEDGMIVKGEHVGKLELNGLVTQSTFVRLGDFVVVDPSLEEDKTMSARLSVAINSDGKICSLQKGDKGSFDRDVVEEIITDRAYKTTKFLRTVLEKEL